MTPKIKLPPLYAILDAGSFVAAPDRTKAIVEFAAELAAGGATLIQFRAKHLPAREMLRDARELRRVLGQGARLIMNDRADLCLAAGFDGVHVGQDDLPPSLIRGIVGSEALVGYSTHNPEQVKEADATPVDYIAVGPVFATASKANPDPVIGLEGVQKARELTSKPLVAIGGITRANCREVIGAGADSVAVIADLLTSPRASVQEFLNLASL